MTIRRAAALATCVLVAACGGGSRPPAPTTPTSPPAPSTTAARVPNLTAEPIPGLAPATIHGDLAKLGFTTAAPAVAPGFVTTTSTRPDATVSTYGKGADDVVKVVAQADKAAAPTVLAAVVAALLEGSEARRADGWVKAELKKGARGPTEPRTARATYGKQPYELLVTTSTATLSVGRLTG